MNKNITIFTPSYNRCGLLKECYTSLINQTSKLFTWLIIDDGSTDDTESFIKKIKSKSEFEIRYYKQENHGKWFAMNKAIDLCDTDYFLFLDSDDKLSNNAIEILNSKIDIINNLDDVSGVIGNTFDEEKNEINGTKIPAYLNYCSSIELMQKHNYKGDTLRMYKTRILKENKFPNIENEKFIPENVVFDKIDSKYKMLIIDDLLYLCIYRDNGYSKNIFVHRHNNPIGYSLSLKTSAEYSVTIKKKISNTILYIIWCINFKISMKDFNYKFRLLLFYPIAIFFNFFKKPDFLFRSINIR